MDSTDRTPTAISSSWWTKSRRAQNEDDFETWKRGGVCPTLNAFDNATESRATVLAFDSKQDGSDSADLSSTLLSMPHDRSHATEDGTGRGTPIIAFGHVNGVDPQASTRTTPTMRAGHDTMPSITGHGVGGVRRLTPRECERLMGLPDDWTAYDADGKPQADSNRYKQCGNAVVVPVAEWIGYLLEENA